MNKRILMKARAIGVLFGKPHTVKVVSKMRKGLAKLAQAQHIDVTIEIPDLPERNELAQNLFGCDAEEAKAKIAEACRLPGGVIMRAMKMKAWSFETDPWEGTYMIVYADTAGQAKRAAMEYVDDDFTEIRVYRVQWADKYGDYDNIPIDAFFKNGWWWPCHKCGTPVYEDNLGGYINEKEPVCDECWKELNHNE